jgi:hypothetical protein
MEKQMMINPGIFRVRFWTGRLVLNENHRNEITHFHDKTIADFVEIKKEKLSLVKSWKRQCRICSSALALIENNGIDLKSFSRGTFPNHLISIRDGKYNKTKPFTSLMILH